MPKSGGGTMRDDDPTPARAHGILLRNPQDRSRIALGEDDEVHYRSEKSGVSKDQLEEAVKAVGNSADAVERHLKG